MRDSWSAAEHIGPSCIQLTRLASDSQPSGPDSRNGPHRRSAFVDARMPATAERCSIVQNGRCPSVTVDYGRGLTPYLGDYLPCPLLISYGIMPVPGEHAIWRRCSNTSAVCTFTLDPIEGIRSPCTCGGQSPDVKSDRKSIPGTMCWAWARRPTKPPRILKKNGRRKD